MHGLIVNLFSRKIPGLNVYAQMQNEKEQEMIQSPESPTDSTPDSQRGLVASSEILDTEFNSRPNGKTPSTLWFFMFFSPRHDFHLECAREVVFVICRHVAPPVVAFVYKWPRLGSTATRYCPEGWRSPPRSGVESHGVTGKKSNEKSISMHIWITTRFFSNSSNTWVRSYYFSPPFTNYWSQLGLVAWISFFSLFFSYFSAPFLVSPINREGGLLCSSVPVPAWMDLYLSFHTWNLAGVTRGCSVCSDLLHFAIKPSPLPCGSYQDLPLSIEKRPLSSLGLPLTLSPLFLSHSLFSMN